MLTTALTVVFIFFLLVVAHELGHLLVAKWCGMRVDRFQVCFGPPILRLGSWGETEISLGPFPFGGFVAIHGMAPGDYFPEERAFHDAPLFKRVLTIAAGPFMSFVLAFVLFVVVGTAFGVMDVKVPPQFGEVEKGKIAYNVGIRSGDEVVQVNSARVTSWEQVAAEIHGSVGKPLYLVLKRGSKEFSVVAVPEKSRVRDLSDPLHPRYQWVGRIYCTPELYRKRIGIGESTVQATLTFVENLKLLVGTLFSPFIKDSFGGPVAIVSAASAASKQGMAEVLWLAGQLSLSLAVVNLFPIPALDGGYLALLFVEFVRRGKKISARLQIGLQAAGVLLILSLLIIITKMDISRLVNHPMP